MIYSEQDTRDLANNLRKAEGLLEAAVKILNAQRFKYAYGYFNKNVYIFRGESYAAELKSSIAELRNDFNRWTDAVYFLKNFKNFSFDGFQVEPLRGRHRKVNNREFVAVFKLSGDYEGSASGVLSREGYFSEGYTRLCKLFSQPGYEVSVKSITGIRESDELEVKYELES